MRRFIPRRFRHDEPPFEDSHQHHIPGPWPIIVLAVMVLASDYLIVTIINQQTKMVAFQNDMLDYIEGKGEFRDREQEQTRALLCAVLPQLYADDAGVLESYAQALGCPDGPRDATLNNPPAIIPPSTAPAVDGGGSTPPRTAPATGVDRPPDGHTDTDSENTTPSLSPSGGTPTLDTEAGGSTPPPTSSPSPSPLIDTSIGICLLTVCANI